MPDELRAQELKNYWTACRGLRSGHNIDEHLCELSLISQMSECPVLRKAAFATMAEHRHASVSAAIL